MTNYLKNKLQNLWWGNFDQNLGLCIVLLISIPASFIFSGLLLGGCGKAAPAKAEVLILRPGQSAVLLDGVTVLARIPAQGPVLYEGPVTIERGTVAIKPVVEN